jgi:hypothetical protein
MFQPNIWLREFAPDIGNKDNFLGIVFLISALKMGFEIIPKSGVIGLVSEIQSDTNFFSPQNIMRKTAKILFILIKSTIVTAQILIFHSFCKHKWQIKGQKFVLTYILHWRNHKTFTNS